MNSASVTPFPQGKPRTVLSTSQLEVDFDGFKAIQGLDFHMVVGELRFLIGPNGAGKTTLLDIICGKVKPTNGSITYNESENLTKYSEHKIARLGIGRKFQAPSIFPKLTVMQNLLLSLKQDRRILATLSARIQKEELERIQSVLTMIGLESQSDAVSGALSHGQKQWLEIGMLLAQDPDLLLLDEPAAGMTDEETEKTGELIHEIVDQKNASVIVVEHDMDFVRRFARKVTVMHEGKILKEGTMHDIQNDEMVAKVYLGRRGEQDAAN